MWFVGPWCVRSISIGEEVGREVGLKQVIDVDDAYSGKDGWTQGEDQEGRGDFAAYDVHVCEVTHSSTKAFTPVKHTRSASSISFSSFDIMLSARYSSQIGNAHQDPLPGYYIPT